MPRYTKKSQKAKVIQLPSNSGIIHQDQITQKPELNSVIQVYWKIVKTGIWRKLGKHKTNHQISMKQNMLFPSPN